jgi:hypothetical protein
VSELNPGVNPDQNHGDRPGGDASEVVGSASRSIREVERCAQALRRAWVGGDRNQLRLLTRELRAVADGSGSPQIAESVLELHEALEEQAAMSDVAKRVEALIQYCRRAGM